MIKIVEYYSKRELAKFNNKIAARMWLSENNANVQRKSGGKWYVMIKQPLL